MNIVPGVESHYWWQGKREQGNEVLLLIKSSAEQFEALAELVRAHHSYECPEIVAIAPRRDGAGLSGVVGEGDGPLSWRNHQQFRLTPLDGAT